MCGTKSSALWCCGSLQSATICIGITNIISHLLLTSYYLGVNLNSDPFNLSLLVLMLIVFFLFVANVALVYGATKQLQLMVLPWLMLHLPAILALIVVTSVKFHVMAGAQPAAILLIAITTHFYVVVATFYLRLIAHAKLGPDKCDGRDISIPNRPSIEEGDVLIAFNESERMQLTTEASVNAKDVQAESCIPKLTDDDSGEFMLPLELSLNFSSNFTHTTKEAVLPVPDEVITLDSIETNADSQVPGPPTRHANSLSVVEMSSALLSHPNPEPRMTEKTSSRSAALIDTIDANFSPFRKCDPASGQQVELPKMKIFLPKQSDSYSSSSSSSSSSDEELLQHDKA